MRFIKYLTLATLVAFVGNQSIAQSEVFNIGSVQTYSGCDAIMHDSNGGLVNYSANSNDQITLCAPAPETQINLYFIGFDLAPGDSIYFFDGSNTAAPSLGAFSGDVLLFETISSSVNGCLTIQFISNSDAEVGDFSVRISCGVPCDYPVAVIDALADTIKICPGDAVNFDGSASFWTTGANLASWTWDFGDATTNTTSWPTVSKTFDTPGGYRVRLYLEDDNNCSSANIPEVLVFVSTPYNFDLEATSEIVCVGTEVFIGTNGFVTAEDETFTNEEQNGNTITWTESNSISFDNGVYIPDNQGCLDAEITFNQFGTATIDSESDIANILVNMEHSFVGDITISIICPTGEVLSLFPEAGQSGIFLGEPIDDESGVPGVGYDYTWSPTSTNGTWMDYIANTGGSPIPAGDYQAEGAWSDLFGCPLNGTWLLEVCDIVGADDGWVFEFGITFAPEFYPEILTFTPEVGSGCDSSYWENPDLFNTMGTDCDWATYTPTVSGSHTFTYHVINDFGCEYTQDISINAVELPIITADDVTYCANGTVLNSTITNPTVGANYSYTWSPATSLSSASSADPLINGLTTSTTYTVTTSVQGIAGCSDTADAFVFVPLPLIPTLPAEQIFCEIEFPLDLTSEDQNNPNAVFSWVHFTSTGQIPAGSTQDIAANGYGQYVLTVSEDDCDTEVVTTYYITPPPPANAGTDFYYCDQVINLNGSVVDPIPGLQYGYSWSPTEPLGNPNTANSAITSSIDEPTMFYLNIFPLGSPNCISTDSVLVMLPTPPNVDSSYTAFPCLEELPYTLSSNASQQQGVTYEWIFDNQDTTYVYSVNGYLVSDLTGVFTLEITEPNCGITASQVITVFPEPCVIEIPNIFTPNGDGNNDTFEIANIDNYDGSTMQVYNRWGGIIFEDNDYSGTWGADGVAEGTYYFIVGINKKSGMEYHSGNVTIVR